MGVRTIRNMVEFAEISGLSRPTVAKYFADPDSVRPATRQKIEAALSRYDYRPNLFAVNLNKKSSNLIGVVVPDTADPFYAAVVRHIELNCAANGHLVIVLSSRGDPQMEARSLDTLLSLRVAGAILSPLGVNSDIAMIDSLRARIPVVFLDSRLDETSPLVGTDNGQSIGLITHYLCRTGSPPAYFEFPPVNRNGFERRASYCATMDRLGLEPLVVTLGTGRHWRFEDIGFTETARLLERGGLPADTILCSNDRLAIGVMAAAYRAGRKVGRAGDCDLRIAGHDDQPTSRYLCPPLTTVAQDVQQLGGRCVDLLLAHIDGSAADADTPEIRLEAKLMMRESA